METSLVEKSIRNTLHGHVRLGSWKLCSTSYCTLTPRGSGAGPLAIFPNLVVPLNRPKGGQLELSSEPHIDMLSIVFMNS